MSPLQRLKLAGAPAVYRLFTGSLRLPALPDALAAPPPADAPVIFACLHRDILPALAFVRSARPVLLISRSPDGDILVRCLGRRGFDFVRGSSGREGGEAFRLLLGRLRAGRHLGLAVDGPRGPFARIHEGVLQLARLGDASIRPVVVRPGPHLNLRNWDRTLLPLPGSRVDVSLAPPLRVPRDAADAVLASIARDLRLALTGKAAA